MSATPRQWPYYIDDPPRALAGLKHPARRAVPCVRIRGAHDLHDELVRGLFTAGLDLNLALTEIPDDRVAHKIKAAITRLDDAITEIRTAAFERDHSA